MNKTITDGLVLMPPPFEDGLGVWSSGDGTPGSDTYAGSGNGAFVPADQDFGGCLEVVKTASIMRLRYMGETTLLPGCYLRVTARVKAIAGALPAVRIAGRPGGAGGVAVPGLVVAAPAVQLTTYGKVVEVSAIIGSGARGGVDMVWPGVIYGHLGLDLTGANGGVVRIDDITIEDVTSVFLRDMLAMVDVRDYGALGDGVTDDTAAFLAADAAADGRVVLVSAGQYRLDGHVTLQNRARFEGTITMPDDRRFILRRDFNFATYFDAFRNEGLAFRKAYQALINFSGHESLDLGGRRIALSAPLNMQATDPERTTFATRRVVRNGQFVPIEGPAWNDTVVTAQATYAPSEPLQLNNVANAATIPVGALINGNGVGREVYVTEVNAGAGRVTLSRALFDAEGTQAFTFRRFKYMLDFSGYASLSQFSMENIEFQGEGIASGIMLAPEGLAFSLRDCFVTRPKDRGITSIGRGCQGMLIDRCQFLSNEQALPVEARSSIGFNANANDVKIRDNRVVRFKHFCVLGGTGTTIVGNHWFHGDDDPAGVRQGGIVLTLTNCRTLITGNYIDNNFIEWTNEHSATPAFGLQFSFGGLTVTGNIFLASNAASWFNFLVIKPHGPGHFIQGLTVVGNVFRSSSGNIDRIEAVDTTYADLDYARMRNITFVGNVFNGINEEIRNPLSMTHVQATPDRNWTVDPGTLLPFRGRARAIEAVVPVGRIADAAGQTVYDAPYVEPEFGAAKQQFRVIYREPSTGTIRCQVRMDNPI